MPPVNRNQPKRAMSSESQYSLIEFMREFPDDATCLEWLWRNRYSKDGKHADCPRCKCKNQTFTRYQTAQQRQSWTCNGCGNHLHPTAGSIFHKSSTSLHLWCYAMYLMTSTRCGISAKQLERELGVTYKTAWRMAKLIRQKLMTDDGEPLGRGNGVEADETYVSGKRRGKTGRPGTGDKKKTAVFGMVERKGARLRRHGGERGSQDAPATHSAARLAEVDRLHRRVERLQPHRDVRLPASAHQPLGAHLCERRCPHKHD